MISSLVASADFTDIQHPAVNTQGFHADGSDPWADAIVRADARPGGILFSKGTFRVERDVTISSRVARQEGALLRPDNGVTVRITGQWDPALFKAFDLSAGGNIEFGTGSIDRALPQWFGAIADSSTDDTTALHKMFASYHRFHFPLGTYKHTAALTCIKSTSVDITADAGTVIEGVGSGYDSLLTGGFVSNFNPTAYGSIVITGNPAAGDESITVAGLGAVAGDILRLTSSDTWADTARGGELVEVLSVSGDVYQLTRPLAQAYTGANTNVLRLTMPRVSIRNLHFKRASNNQGLVIRGARDLHLDSVRCTGARYAGIVVQFIYGGEIRNCSTADVWYSGSGTSYGLEVTTSYDVDIHSNHLFGGRHALSLANYEPNRFIRIHDNTLANRDEESDGALNLHNGAEHCIVHHNNIDGGVEGAAVNLRFTNNQIRAKAPNNVSPVVLSLVRSCDYVIVEDNTVEGIATASAPAPLYIRVVANGVTIKRIRIKDNDISGLVSLQQGGIWIAPISSAGGANCTIQSLDVIDNEVRLASGGSNQAYAFLVNDNAKGDTFFPVLTRVNMRGGYYKNPSGRTIGFINQNTGTKNGEIRLRDVDAEGTSQTYYCDGASVWSVKGSRVAGGGSIYTTQVTRLTELVGNRIYNAVVNSGIEGGAVGEAIIENCYFNCKGQPSTSYPGWGTIGGRFTTSQNEISFGSTVPSTGTYKRGDVRYKTDVAAGGSPGWACVTSGTYSAYSATGGATTLGSAVITGLSTTTGLSVGDYVTASAGFASSVVRVESIDSASQITVNENAASTQAAVAVSTPDPVWKAMANVAV